MSIGIPTYNRVTTLRRALESALAQDYGNLEVVISDNGSDDATQDYCESICQTDSRVRYVRQQTNQGASFNFREVLARARGLFFMWLSDDDWLHPAYIRTCVQALLEDSRCILAVGSVIFCRHEESLFEEATLQLLNRDPAKRVYRYFRRVGTNGVFYGVTRTQTLRTIRFHDCLGADWLLIAELVVNGTLRRVEGAAVYRSIEGSSSDVSRLAANRGMSRLAVWQPHSYIAWAAFRDVGWRSSGYKRLGAARLLLATRVLMILLARYTVYPPVRRFAVRLRLLSDRTAHSHAGKLQP